MTDRYRSAVFALALALAMFSRTRDGTDNHMLKNPLCPCHSGKPYPECCKPYHTGERLPENALQLMRSRYAAYALHLVDYIIGTTHPDNPAYLSDKKRWKKEILSHYGQTNFYGLKIVDFIDGETEAFVTFTAYLKQDSHDVSFTERSRFLQVQEQWLYESGVIIESSGRR